MGTLFRTLTSHKTSGGQHPTMIEAPVEKATDGSHSTAPRSAVDFTVQREANLIRTQMMLMLDQQAFDIAKQCVRASKFVSIKQLLVIHPIFEDSEKND